jgi:pantoate--beta-alanine ligase
MTDTIVRSPEHLRHTLGDHHPGLVPTMGALHPGHLSLIARSARENALTVVSVFVNPTQFGDVADLARYPRDLERDAALAADAGANIVFAPAAEDIYQPGFTTTIDVGPVANRWEGASRPGHFRAVATVVAILLNLVQPARSYFGEKDFQQLLVIQQMHRDLRMPGAIVACPTVRDADGLALSSRNSRLSPTDRERALALPRAIAAARQAVANGETTVSQVESVVLAALDQPGITIDYAAVVDGETLEPLHTVQPNARLVVAADVGGTRLIDNVALELVASA